MSLLGGGERRGNVLNLDLPKRLNKQRQGQYGKKTRSTKGVNLVPRVISASKPLNSSQRKYNYKDHIQIKETTQISTFHHSKPPNLNYKEDSPKADTKIQSLLLPKGSNLDTFREEKAYCKKIWMDPEHHKSSSCTCSSP